MRRCCVICAKIPCFNHQYIIIFVIPCTYIYNSTRIAPFTIHIHHRSKHDEQGICICVVVLFRALCVFTNELQSSKEQIAKSHRIFLRAIYHDFDSAYTYRV